MQRQPVAGFRRPGRGLPHIAPGILLLSGLQLNRRPYVPLQRNHAVASAQPHPNLLLPDFNFTDTPGVLLQESVCPDPGLLRHGPLSLNPFLLPDGRRTGVLQPLRQGRVVSAVLVRRAQHIPPQGLHHRAHVIHAAVDGDHHILIRTDNAVLSEGAVAAEHMLRPAHPELIAVSLSPVVFLVFPGPAVVGPGGLGVPDPGFIQQLFSVPASLLQIELSHLRDVFHPHVHAVSAGGDAAGAFLRPDVRAHAQRIQEFFPQIVQRFPSRRLLQHRAQHIGSEGVIQEMRSRLMLHIAPQERRLVVVSPVPRLGLMPRVHGQQILHRDLLHVFAGSGRKLFRKIIHQPVRQLHQPVLHGESHRRGSKALAQ